jgi:hypothetical protein
MQRILTLLGILVFIFVLSIDYSHASNKSRSEEYCKQQAKDGIPCKISKWVGCGKGWTMAKRFNQDRGKDWFACKQTAFAKGTEKNKRKCQEWCAKNKDCKKCANWRGCGVGYKKLKSFRGKGKDWFACQKTDYATGSDKNKEKCEEWCENNRDCEKCSKLPGCGYGFKRAKKFGGKGKAWYACQKRGSASVNAVWPSNKAAKASHRALVVSLGGAFGRFGRDGIEWFARDYLSNYKKQILYVGSYGSIWTVSQTLADNIKSLAKAIEKKSGKKPKVILIGKSMGGCKEHHATRKMGDFPIDLFISVDLCCSTKCWAKKGDSGAKKYRRNVKKFVNFYQAKKGESMCGHLIAYDGTEPDPKLNINVNKDGFDFVKWVKLNGKKLCNNVGHKGDNGIDKCRGLKNHIKNIVLKEVDIGTVK